MLKKIIVSILFTSIFLESSRAVSEENNPYQFEGAVTLESISNLHGGIGKGTRNLANLDATLTIDTQAANWWQNGSWFIYVLGDYGKNPSELSGDIQTLSNIATDNALKIYEFWYEHRFFNEEARLLVGLHDYNSTFYSLDSARLFSLASFGIGPDTSQVGPSIFSTTSMAIHFSVQKNNFYGLLAVYDGIPGDPNNPRGTHIQFNKGDGLFKAAEFGLNNKDNYKLGLGFWQKTSRVENPVNGQPMNNNHGYYVIGEKYLAKDVVTFFQFGRADDEKNQLDRYAGAGIRLNNYWKEEDALGVGVAQAHNGLPFLRENTLLDSAETIWELAYFRPIGSHLSAQGSFYYVKNPGMDSSLDNALAVGFRLFVEF